LVSPHLEEVAVQSVPVNSKSEVEDENWTNLQGCVKVQKKALLVDWLAFSFISMCVVESSSTSLRNYVAPPM
jgi:hypothetical protein